jgi:isochorismate hydrolase
MKEHHDELLQNVAEISHQYNELQDLLKKKQKMIVEGTTTSIEDVNRYFETYINELCQTKQNIITNIENTKQNAEVKTGTLMIDILLS